MKWNIETFYKEWVLLTYPKLHCFGYSHPFQPGSRTLSWGRWGMGSWRRVLDFLRARLWMEMTGPWVCHTLLLFVGGNKPCLFFKPWPLGNPGFFLPRWNPLILGSGVLLSWIIYLRFKIFDVPNSLALLCKWNKVTSKALVLKFHLL